MLAARGVRRFARRRPGVSPTMTTRNGARTAAMPAAIVIRRWRRSHRENVERLKIAWTYRTGELGAGFARADTLTFEATPILVRRHAVPQHADQHRDRARPGHRRAALALRPADSIATRRYSEATSRGVSSWIDETAGPNAACAHRIFIGTLDARLIALDGRSGRPCRDFGSGGKVDLGEAVRGRHERATIWSPRRRRSIGTSSSSARRSATTAASNCERGIVRAFDARTGALRWSWDPIPTSARGSDAARLDRRSRRDAPAPRTPGRCSRSMPAAAWCSCPPARRARTSSAASAPATTGTRTRWSRCAPNRRAGLASAARASRPVGLRPAGAADADRHRARRQIDSRRRPGDQDRHAVRVRPRDRRAGVRDRRAARCRSPTSPGEATSPTQPFPATPPLVSHAAVTPQDAWGLTVLRSRQVPRPDRALSLRRHLHAAEPARHDPVAGLRGGVNWGSLAFDSERQLVIAAVNHVPMVVTLVPRDQFEAMQRLGAPSRTRSSRRRPARPTACAAKCWPRRSACRARRRRGERWPPSTCGATRSAGR